MKLQRTNNVIRRKPGFNLYFSVPLEVPSDTNDSQRVIRNAKKK